MRRILSLRIPSFHTAVAALLDPALCGRALIVYAGRQPHEMVIGVSPEASALGAAAGMGLPEARDRCPDAALVEYDRTRFAPFAAQVGSILNRYASWVELFHGADDEWFADLGEGGIEDGREMAERIRQQTADEIGLKACVGLAGSKLAARVAASFAAEDGGVRVVCEGRERSFLAPVPVETLWDLKPDAVRRLHRQGLQTLGQLAALSPRALVPALGPAGVWYHQLARGRDRRPVAEWIPAPSETAACFVDAESPDKLPSNAMLERLGAQIAERMQPAARCGRVLNLTLHLTGGRRLFMARRLDEPIHCAGDVAAAARGLLALLRPRVTRALAAATVSWLAQRQEEMTFDRAGLMQLLQDDCALSPVVPLHGRTRVEALELSLSGLELQNMPKPEPGSLFFGDSEQRPVLRALLARTRDRSEASAHRGTGLAARTSARLS